MTPFKITIFFTIALFIMNFILFLLREIEPSLWWIFDFQVYDGVGFDLHLIAFQWFILYLVIFSFLIIRGLSISKNLTPMKKNNFPKMFVFVIILHIVLAISAVKFGVAVAAGIENQLGSLAYIFYFFSFDGLYFAYALVEKNKQRLLIASIFFIVSNICRGWGGFLIYLIPIYFIRNKNNISLKYFIIVFVSFISITPISLYIRDIFRQGIFYEDSFNLDDIFDMEIFVGLLQKLLTRFDFYSSYIGVSSMKPSDYSEMCVPLTENIIIKILKIIGFQIDCTPLPAILPGYLYSFFANRAFNGSGTSFTISSGFFALPIKEAIIYLFSYLLVLLTSISIMRTWFNQLEYILYFIFLVFMLLFQGWMYQYIYIFSGYIVGMMLILKNLEFKLQ